MNARWLRILAVTALVGVFVLQNGAAPSAQADGYSRLNRIQKRLLSGLADLELNPANHSSQSSPSNYLTRGNSSCPVNLSSNIKVNQNCLNLSDPDLLGRGQAQNETAIAVDPNQPNQMIASFNDYRRGDGNCYASYSLDGGRTWNDSTIPMSFTRGTAFGGAAREYWQAGGDTSVAWDTQGNAYLDCQMFMRGSPTSPNPDLSSAVYVFRSTQNNGASWNFPGRPVVESNDVTGANGSLPFEDKPYMTVDNHAGSPFQDRVYVTWTEFAADGSAYIWESYSADYGETFSAPRLVSTDSSLCPVTYGFGTPQGRCNENQFSQPFTGPDGMLYVVYANFNNATASASDNHNQILMVKSTDGGNSFGAPVKVSDYYDLPDCATYQAGQDAFRACVPEKGASTNSVFRATNYPSGAVNPTNPAQVVVAFGSYINANSNETNGCVPAGVSSVTGINLYTGVKTPGACNNDVLLSVSTDAGTSFTGTTNDPRTLTTVNQAAGQATTDQWWQWIAFTKNGKLAVSYYDRQYGFDETTGNMDVSLSSSGDLARFSVQRVTSSSMPLPTEFPNAQGNGVFFGDYTGLAAYTNANPLWMDTRNPLLVLCPGSAAPGTPPAVCGATMPNGLVANDQDVYTASVAVTSK